MSGVTRIPTTMPPARADWSGTPNKGLRISGERKLMAKKPRTMVGIPAMVSSTGLTTLRTRFEEYSESRIADSNPAPKATEEPKTAAEVTAAVNKTNFVASD